MVRPRIQFSPYKVPAIKPTSNASTTLQHIPPPLVDNLNILQKAPSISQTWSSTLETTAATPKPAKVSTPRISKQPSGEKESRRRSPRFRSDRSSVLSPAKIKKAPLRDKSDKKPHHRGTPVKRRQATLAKAREFNKAIDYIDDYDEENESLNENNDNDSDASYNYEEYNSSIMSPVNLSLTPGGFKKGAFPELNKSESTILKHNDNSMNSTATPLTEYNNEKSNKDMISSALTRPLNTLYCEDNRKRVVLSGETDNARSATTISTGSSEFDDSDDDVMKLPVKLEKLSDRTNNRSIVNGSLNKEISIGYRSNDENSHNIDRSISSRSINIEKQTNIAVSGTTRHYENSEDDGRGEKELDSHATILRVTEFVNQKRLELSMNKKLSGNSSFNSLIDTTVSSDKAYQGKKTSSGDNRYGDPFVNNDRDWPHQQQPGLFTKDKNMMNNPKIQPVKSSSLSSPYVNTKPSLATQRPPSSPYITSKTLINKKDNRIPVSHNEFELMNSKRITSSLNSEIVKQRQANNNNNNNNGSQGSKDDGADKWDSGKWIRLFKYLKLYSLTHNQSLCNSDRINRKFNCSVDELVLRANILKKFIEVEKIKRRLKK